MSELVYFQVLLRVAYLSASDEIVIKLGNGRRPRPVAQSLTAEAQVWLGARGQLARLLVFDNKLLHLGKRLQSLPQFSDEDPVPGEAVGYDLSARVVQFLLASLPDEFPAQRVQRVATIDFDAQERLVSLRISVPGARRREPDLYAALAHLPSS